MTDAEIWQSENAAPWYPRYNKHPYTFLHHLTKHPLLLPCACPKGTKEKVHRTSTPFLAVIDLRTFLPRLTSWKQPLIVHIRQKSSQGYISKFKQKKTSENLDLNSSGAFFAIRSFFFFQKFKLSPTNKGLNLNLFQHLIIYQIKFGETSVHNVPKISLHCVSHNLLFQH